MRVKSHTLLSIAVLVAAAIWVGTGKFTSVGSASGAEQTASATPSTPDAPENKASAPVQTVAYVTAEAKDYLRSFRIAGKTQPDKQTVLAARTAGVVSKLPAAKGDTVSQGDLLMAVEGPEKYTAVEAAKALLQQRTHQADVNSQLFDRGKISSIANDESQAAMTAAKSSLVSAQAEVDKLEVRAPFAGVVDDVQVEAGAWVQPGAPVATLLALDPIIAAGQISERDLGDVAVGNTAKVRFGDGVEATGKVRFIGREASSQTLTFPVEIAVPNPSGKISAGMSADIVLSANVGRAVVLPRSVVTLDADGQIGVQTLTDGDVVKFLKVTLIDDTPKGIVLGDIPSGTRIIVSGQDLVTDGQTVKAVAASAGASDG